LEHKEFIYTTQFVPSKLVKRKLTLNIEDIYTLKIEAAGSSETLEIAQI
jgi:hypothetical protein